MLEDHLTAGALAKRMWIAQDSLFAASMDAQTLVKEEEVLLQGEYVDAKTKP